MNYNKTNSFTNSDSLLRAQDIASLWYIFNCMVYPPSLFLGVLGNIINCAVFVRIGLKETVTVSLFILTLSDLAYLLINFTVIICWALSYSSLTQFIQFNIATVGVIVSYYEYLFYDYSMLVTTYIAVTRCCCVVMPLKFKAIFTVRKTLLVFLAMLIVNLVLKLPLLSTIGLHWLSDPTTNSTRLGIWVSHNRDSVRKMHDIVNQNGIPYTTTCITIVAVLILQHKLIMASKTRLQMTSSSHAPLNINTKAKTTFKKNQSGFSKARKILVFLSTRDDTSDTSSGAATESTGTPMLDMAISPMVGCLRAGTVNKDEHADLSITNISDSLESSVDPKDSGNVDLRISNNSSEKPTFTNASTGRVQRDIQKTTTSLSKRELQVIKVVILVSTCFILNVLFFACKAMVRIIEPEFDIGRKYGNLYSLLTLVGYTFSHIKAGINPLIYYHFNGRYKEVFLHWFNPCYKYNIKKISEMG